MSRVLLAARPSRPQARTAEPASTLLTGKARASTTQPAVPSTARGRRHRRPGLGKVNDATFAMA